MASSRCPSLRSCLAMPGAEVEQAEDRRDNQDAGLRRLAFLVDQRQELRHADCARDEEQAVPALVDPDDRGAEEDERHEARSGGRRLIVEQGEDGHEHRTDEAEARDDLRRPVERERDGDGCDPRCQRQSDERRHQARTGPRRRAASRSHRRCRRRLQSPPRRAGRSERARRRRRRRRAPTRSRRAPPARRGRSSRCSRPERRRR